MRELVGYANHEIIRDMTQHGLFSRENFRIAAFKIDRFKGPSIDVDSNGHAIFASKRFMLPVYLPCVPDN